MNLKRSFLGAAAAVVALVSGLLAVRMASHAAEPPAAVRVDGTPLNRDPQSGNSYAPVIKKVAPSVVNIYSTRFVKERRYHNPLMADPLFRQFFGDQNADAQPRMLRQAWIGCGIIVTPNGYILTANHVVDGADEIKVGVENDRTEYSARVVGMDPPTDVAILKIEAKNLPAATLGDSDQLEVGDVVMAIGNPFGIGQTVTRGIISALGRSLVDSSGDDSSELMRYQNFIQTDAPINEGNSGGALVDATGRLIGINDAIISPSGGSAGIGFAVPINLARSVMDGFLKNGKVARGELAGVEFQDIDAGLAKGFGAPNVDGVLVSDVKPDSVAAKAGLAAGDIIVNVNGKDVSGRDNLGVTVSQLPPGSVANLKVYRNGVQKLLAIVLAESAGLDLETIKPAANNPQPARADALTGVQVRDLTPRLRWQLGAQRDLPGALVMSVDRSSNSYEAGLRQYDVILEINRQPVANASEAVRLGWAARTDTIVIKVWRPTGNNGGRNLFLDVDNTKRAN
jgi:Do/DeqQ family serine protease